MATDFWASSHYKRWIVDRGSLQQARAEDVRYVEDPEYLDFLAIYFANIISKLGKKLQLRQRVIATATVFFRRFYLKNSYCETDPFMVISACCYVAAKAEESPVHIKSVVAESRALFSQEHYNMKTFPSDNTKLAEMEFYLVDDLECDLTVFHPYRTLLALCKKAPNTTSPSGSEEGEAGEVGVGVGDDDGPRYWGTGEGQLEMAEGALQTAWFIINDTYRSEMCLIYPPHLIAIAAIYLTYILHQPTRATIVAQLPSRVASASAAAAANAQSDSPQSQSQSQTQASHSTTTTTTSSSSSAPPPQPRRSSRQAQNASAAASESAHTKKPPQDPIGFLAGLNVSLPLVATIAQEIISLYSLWDRYKEDGSPEGPKVNNQGQASGSSPYASTPAGGGGGTASAATAAGGVGGSGSPLKRSASSSSRSANQSSSSSTTTPVEMMTTTTAMSATMADNDDFYLDGDGRMMVLVGWNEEVPVTPSFLSGMLLRMREARLGELVHGSSSSSSGGATTTGTTTTTTTSGAVAAGGGGTGGRQMVAVNKVLERTQAAG